MKALVFRLPWKLWRHLEGGRMAEFGMEAKRHLHQDESSENLAHQVRGSILRGWKKRVYICH